MKMTVMDEGDKIVLVINDKRVCDMPIEVAQVLVQVLNEKIKKIDELQNVHQIVRDQAIMQRAGMPFGISSHPKIQAEAKKMAEWDSELRRAMPLRGIEPQSIVGTPSLRKQ